LVARRTADITRLPTIASTTTRHRTSSLSARSFQSQSVPSLRTHSKTRKTTPFATPTASAPATIRGCTPTMLRAPGRTEHHPPRMKRAGPTARKASRQRQEDDMCRWMAYRGQPLLVELLLYKTKHSLIEQSRHARLGVETFNGDGFGLGWYDDDAHPPGLYRNLLPAWGDRNLRHLAAHINSRLFLAHVRATTGTPVQETNCHPFGHGSWLFVHNGAIDRYHEIRRELVLAVDPAFFDTIEGSTDSELMFALALTFGLTEDPIPALERMAGFVEETGHAHGVEHPLQMTLGVSDGERLYAVRYSSIGQSRTLFASADATTVRALYPEDARLQQLTAEDRAVVSEPLSDLPGIWIEVPESTALVIQDGPDEQRAFQPQPALAGAA
jgi:predicted glutamine amidotransferase